jgi:hypothetical protein
MPRLRLGATVQRYSGGTAELLVEGRTVRQVLESACPRPPGLRSYVLDDQGGSVQLEATDAGGQAAHAAFTVDAARLHWSEGGSVIAVVARASPTQRCRSDPQAHGAKR